MTTKTQDDILFRKAVRKIKQAVTAEMDKFTLKSGYVETDHIPDDVRMDIDRRTAGQICTTSYGGHGAPEHDYGDPYMTETDSSVFPARVKRYRWIEPKLEATDIKMCPIFRGEIAFSVSLGTDVVIVFVRLKFNADFASLVAEAMPGLVDEWNGQF